MKATLNRNVAILDFIIGMLNIIMWIISTHPWLPNLIIGFLCIIIAIINWLKYLDSIDKPPS